VSVVFSTNGLWFGLGCRRRLPEGWQLKESADDWAIGIAPDGQEYFIGARHAFPKRIAEAGNTVGFAPGEVFMDTETGVLDLPEEGGGA
jgi:hypothetical protein